MLSRLLFQKTSTLPSYFGRLVSLIILGCCIFLLYNSQLMSLSSVLFRQDELSADQIRSLELKNIKNSVPKNHDPSVKLKFDEIYRNLVWSEAGGGSGQGSTIEFTENCRQILQTVIAKYSIKSMLDAPCGSFLWMPIMLRNISAHFGQRGERFKYHGVDVVEKIINESKIRYVNESSDWQFSVCDFSQQDLPNGYELVFSRDALQHLSYEKIFYSLRAYSRVKGARYLLVGSYLNNLGQNRNIRIGDTFLIDLTKSPFNLTQYVRVYSENNKIHDPKSLILYDITNYLRHVDFDRMKINLGII